MLKDFADSIGMDLPRTLARFSDEEEFLVSCLLQLDEDGTYETVVSSWTSANLEALITGVHTLKGVAGNLGLDKLYQAAKDLLEYLRETGMEGADVLYREVCEQYVVTENMISLHLAE